jgi:3-phenylpropionate/trans-cinnamate dioxygenase ferredoxin reductase component
MKSQDISSILIVGAGHCGGRVVQHLREYGFQGHIDLVGNESSAPYERPPLSKDVLTGTRLLDEIDLMPAHTMVSLKISRHIASVLSINTELNTALLSNGNTLTYDALLLANGGIPRRLNIPGEDLPGVMVLRTKDDALRLSRYLTGGQRIVIIGGGFIGLEVAASAHKLGCKVTLIEGAPHLMGRAVPRLVADRAKAVHLGKGVDLRLGVSPLQIVTDKTHLMVALSNGSMVSADAIVVGIGIVPCVEIARAAGIATARGILVNAQLRTNAANIYAAGDIAEFPSPVSGQLVRQETWQNAESQARIAARNLLGHNVDFDASSWFWSDQYEYQLQVSGEPAAGVGTAVREQEDGDLIVFYLDSDNRVVGMCGWGLTSRILKDLKIARTLVERGVISTSEVLSGKQTKLKTLLR